MTQPESKKAREWTLCYDSNFDDHPPVVIAGPDITPQEMEVEVVERMAYLKAILALKVYAMTNETFPEYGDVARQTLRELGEIV